MSKCINEVTLLGYLGKSPVTRKTQDGKDVVSFSLATTKTWKDDQGERHERTEWHNVVVFRKGLTEIAQKYLRKGSRVLVRGELQTRKWTDKDKIDRYSTEVVLSQSANMLVLLDGKAGDNGDTTEDDGGSQDADEYFAGDEGYHPDAKDHG